MRIAVLVLCSITLLLVCSSKVSDDSQSKQNPIFLNETYSSGFLSNQNGADLFYILFNSRSAPETDPFIIWLTGGPGCSSELAMFTENGPYKINAENLTLSTNPYSWNTRANLLYVDQPAGTGFSSVGQYDTTEDEVSRDFYNFLLEFLEVHPWIKEKDLYITGESYAGHYIPVIASYIIDQQNPDLNVKGVAIGNGWVDPVHQYPAYTIFALENDLIDSDTFDALTSEVATCMQDFTLEDYTDAARDCTLAYKSIVQNPKIFNIYDIRLPCIGPVCYDFSAVDQFLALPEVQEALGVVGRSWTECNNVVHSFLALDHETDYSPYVKDLLDQGIPVLVYNGEMDYICNYLGGEAWTHALEYNGHEEFVATEYAPFGTDGEYKSVKGLTLLKMYDAGHLVPMDQPEASLRMLEDFIGGKFDN